jgi:hypothetical protein
VLNPDAANRNYVWYVSYGSNIWRDRFMCYVKGGTPVGGAREYKGCADKADPLDERNLPLTGRLYFAGQSKTWHDGGMAYFDPRGQGEVLSKAYLISFDQFLDVVSQENRQEVRISLSLGEITDRESVDTGLEFYPLLLNLGELDGYPLLTFTAREPRPEPNRPDPDYLAAIGKGLEEAYSLSESESLVYLQHFI